MKILAAAVAAYRLSPIDLIPDFIPVLGYLDDLVIVPFGIRGVVKLVPADVLVEPPEEAGRRLAARPRAGQEPPRSSRYGSFLAVAILWLALIRPPSS